MYTSFYIEKNRLRELKLFIRHELKTARFRHNPLLIGNSRYNIALDLSIQDANKLGDLRNKWHKEDNPIKPNKKGLYKRVLDFFN